MERKKHHPSMIHAVELWKEFANLKKFGDSLLSRASKLSDLIGDLEEGLSKKPDFASKDRAKKSWPHLFSSNSNFKPFTHA